MSVTKPRKTTAWWSWVPASSKKANAPKKPKTGIFRKNYIPPAIAILAYLAFIWYFFPVKDIISSLVLKFVELLQITKVLKLSLLTDKRLYDYSALAVVTYISFAVFLDLLRFLHISLFRTLEWEGDRLALTTWGWKGRETVRWNPNQPGIQILHRNGLLRRILGLEKLVFFTNLSGAGISTVAESPYFTSRKNSAFVHSLFDSE